jgi:hypothetical protein
MIPRLFAIRIRQGAGRCLPVAKEVGLGFLNLAARRHSAFLKRAAETFENSGWRLGREVNAINANKQSSMIVKLVDGTWGTLP